MKSRLTLYPRACFPLHREVSDVLVTWRGHAFLCSQVRFCFATLGSCAWRWAVYRKEAATSFSPVPDCVGIFFQDVKEKRILSDALKPPEFIKKLLLQTPFNKSCLNFLEKKIMLCFSVLVLILYIRIVMMMIPFHRLPWDKKNTTNSF